MRRLLFAILSVLVLTISFFFVLAIKNETNQFVKNKQNAVEVLNFEDRLLTTQEWFFTEHEGRRRVLKAQKQYEEADTHYNEAKSMATWLVIILVIYFLLTYIISLGSGIQLKLISIGMIIICFALLAVGILIPMLEIGAYNQELTVKVLFNAGDIPILKEIPFIGDIEVNEDVVFQGKMYYYYQNKSITDIIGILWKSENFVVAISIIGFSIGIPVIKLLGTLYFLMRKQVNLQGFIYRLLGKLGKWSMADVFVVAAFLAYLSFYNMNTGIDTEANTLFGLYFFLTYVVLSIIVSFISDWAIKKENSSGNFEKIKNFNKI